jgi:CheY-like chemotaxis protein
LSGTATESDVMPPATDTSETLTILLAHKDTRRLSAMRGQLQREGFLIVAEAGDADEAIDAAMRRRPNLCLIEAELPGDGIAVTRHIHGGLTATKVAVLARDASEESALSAIRAGADGYLLDGAEMSRLGPALRAVASGEPALPRSLTARFVHDLRVAIPTISTHGYGRLNRTFLYVPRFMRHFRRRLLSGMPSGEAWHSARLRMRHYAYSRERA